MLKILDSGFGYDAYCGMPLCNAKSGWEADLCDERRLIAKVDKLPCEHDVGFE